jgi:hypothetical protein
VQKECTDPLETAELREEYMNSYSQRIFKLFPVSYFLTSV